MSDKTNHVCRCLGMQASASTWIYNLALDLASTSRSVKGFFIAYHRNLEHLDNPDFMPIVKSHGLDASTEAGLSQRVRAIIVSIRDPRDSVASLVKYHHLPFREALREVERAAVTCARFAEDHRSILFRYESRFMDKPETIDKIAAIFGRSLPAEEREQAFYNSRRENIEKLICSLERSPLAKRAGDHIYDEERQWHKSHANRSGVIGKWREILAPPDVARIELHLAHWMRSFGYMPETKSKLIGRASDLVDRTQRRLEGICGKIPTAWSHAR